MEKIRLCPTCHQKVKIQPGMNNWKNLFRKPTLEDYITLFIMLAVIALYFFYMYDIKQYTDYIEKNCQKQNINNNITVVFIIPLDIV
jgi:hypothetical protein